MGGGFPGTGPGAAALSHGSMDHGELHLHGGQAPVHTPVPLPANGQIGSQSPAHVLSPFAHASQMLEGLGQAHLAIVFPQFTGENPRLWKTLCEQYFTMFGIHSTFWVPMACLNFSGTAFVWLQSLQKKLQQFDWESFTTLLCTRFGRDRHQLLIR